MGVDKIKYSNKLKHEITEFMGGNPHKYIATPMKDGSIQADKNRFPSGIKNLTDYLHSKGLLFGLYTSAGLYTCSSGGRDEPIPGSYGHYEQDAKTFANWGVDYVKIDWCNTKVNGKEIDPETVHTEFSKALNATGRPIFLNLCRGYSYPPPSYTAKVANSWRVNGDHHDRWDDSTSHVIEIMAPVAKYAGPGGWNDPDFLMTGGAGCDDFSMSHCPGQTDIEYKTEFSIWSITASPLLVSTDIRNMTSIMKEILLNKEILAVNQDKRRVAGGRVGFHDCSEGKEICQIWARPLEGLSKAVVLYNAGKDDHDIVLDFKQIGWEGKKVMIRDLWAHKDLGSFTGDFKSHVVSHGCTMLNITLTDE
ncbi:uncharacterized protein LOC134194089 isoform X2 [Corticium candelabrum]|uniref:uncharacterized protein LOC134194089 isoform X2 n=1 Tax=Corticium candelabrum TaxID=121492 RepID=UPI002E26FC9C|nr:uncharacterized protein LOC134194089 isoform X2 [Corticium candelabrum]XP_062518979.1 uncharacterized protein LOC134194089 isoform X2 [Corticium candelabrum]